MASALMINQLPNYELFKEQSQQYSLLRLDGKDPQFAEGKKWQRWCSKKRTYEQIGFKPGQNAGIACGPASGVIVLDEDHPEFFKEWLNGRPLPDTRTHQTGSRTRHFLYQYPDDGKVYGCRSFKRGKQTICDIKGFGGQVVAPGSIHPETGKPYIVLKDIPIVPAPEWLLELALKDNDQESDSEQVHTSPDVDVDIDSLPIKERTKRFILDGASKGGRSEPIMTVCNALVYADLTNDQIFQIFDTYPIGAKYREKGHSRHRWLEGRIKKARAKIKDRAKPRGFPCTDLGNAERFAAQHREKVRYVHMWDKWLIWDGRRWKQDGTAAVVRMAKETVRAIYKEAAECQDDDTRKALARWARSSESRAKIEAMLALSMSEAGIPVEPQELDNDDWLFNCLNGTIDLRSGSLKPHNPRDLITRLAPVTADHTATAPMWQKFQQQITNDNQDLIQFKQRIYGSALTGDTSDQCLFLHYGTGANGKSTELETIKALLGDYAKQAEFSTFLVRKNETVRNDIADLRGARFVSAIEAESGQRLAESIVKQMTGGDTLKARFLFKEHFEFKPTFKIFLAANHKPVIRGTDHAIWRRIRLIPFTVTIPEQERDPRLSDKLKAEASGILNWLLIGCAEWQESGLGVSQDVKEATEAYRDEMDTLSEFINECCLVDQQCRVTKQELYEKYEKWCSENGEEPLKKRTFGIKVTERGFQDDRLNKARFWKGIGTLERSHLELIK